MAYVSKNQSSSDSVDVVVTYRTTRTGVPVYILSSPNGWDGWVLDEMTPRKSDKEGEVFFEKTLNVQKDQSKIIYKFRIGQDEWVYDTTASTEPDGYNGMNNKFDIPATLPPTPPPELQAEDEGQTPRPMNDSDVLPLPSEATTSDVNIDQYSLPSPAQSPREEPADSEKLSKENLQSHGASESMADAERHLGDESGAEIEAPSEPDWDPTSEDDRISQADRLSEPEMLAKHGSPTSSIGGYPMSDNADWILI